MNRKILAAWLLFGWLAIAAGATALAFNPVTVVDPAGINQAQVDSLGDLNVINSYAANTAGGGCNGHNATTEAFIIRQNYISAAIAASTATTQIVAGGAGLMLHICAIDITGVLTTAGTLTLSSGTGSNCGTGNAAVENFALGTASSLLFALGDGHDGFKDLPSGASLCIASGAYVATVGPFVNITYASPY